MSSTLGVAFLPVAFISIVSINMMGEWAKGNDMNTKTTMITKFYMFLRKLTGNILVVTAAVGISATAGDAGLQLQRKPRG